MQKISSIKIILGILLLVPFLFLVWIQLPLEIKRYSEIKKGEMLILNIEKYYSVQKKLPNTDDWETLRKLNLVVDDISWLPEYRKTSESSYILRYLEGFDGPYLTYDSQKKSWSLSLKTYFYKE